MFGIVSRRGAEEDEEDDEDEDEDEEDEEEEDKDSDGGGLLEQNEELDWKESWFVYLFLFITLSLIHI